MRLWSIHPKYLDQKGLVACWRESLLAKHVLEGKTRGYRNHPQLIRFRQQKDPVASVNAYLAELWKESKRRGYSFNKDKIGKPVSKTKIKVTQGQLKHEFEHLSKKLRQRDIAKYTELKDRLQILPNPLFKPVKGPRKRWKRV
jgi:hypothetical protein